MRILPYVFSVSSSLFLISSPLYAACSSGYMCANFNMEACITTSTGSCAAPDSPVVIYNGGWAGPFGGTISFPAFANGALPTAQTYSVTLGTLDNPNVSIADALTIIASSTNTTISGTDYFTLTNTTSPGTPIPYQVSYQACSGAAEVLTPSASTLFPASEVSFISTNPGTENAPCHPQDGGTTGNGAGQLSFQLFNPENTVFAGGDYTGTLTLTVCTEGGACV